MIVAVFATFFVGFSGCRQLTPKQDVKPKSATAGKIPTYDEIPAVRTRAIRTASEGLQSLSNSYLPFLEVKTKAQLDSLLKVIEGWNSTQQNAFEQQYGYSSMFSTFNAGLNMQKMYLSA
ncbi:MAG TPA: hypothetical protein DCM08_05235, partial [Microscillaceae bacterium]|nr:hypothetical protein [Microscillaceae bacterium]